MEVTITLPGMHQDVQFKLIDVWYKENYWTTTSTAIGPIKTGPLKIDKGHRKAYLWDGTGMMILELFRFDFPPYHINDAAVRGEAFFHVKERVLRYGSHAWLHSVGDTVK